MINQIPFRSLIGIPSIFIILSKVKAEVPEELATTSEETGKKTKTSKEKGLSEHEKIELEFSPLLSSQFDLFLWVIITFTLIVRFIRFIFKSM